MIGPQIPRANVSFLFCNTPLAFANENRLSLLRWLDVFSKRAFFSHAIIFPPNLFFSKRFSMRFSWILFSILHCGRFGFFSYIRSFSRVRDSTNIFWKCPNFENHDWRCRCKFGRNGWGVVPVSSGNKKKIQLFHYFCFAHRILCVSFRGQYIVLFFWVTVASVLWNLEGCRRCTRLLNPTQWHGAQTTNLAARGLNLESLRTHFIGKSRLSVCPNGANVGQTLSKYGVAELPSKSLLFLFASVSYLKKALGFLLFFLASTYDTAAL